MRKILTFLMVILLSMPFVFADFSVDSQAINNKVLPGETAEYELTVTNNGGSSDTFKIIKPEWNIRSDPLSDFFNGMTIGAGQSKTTKLMIFVPGNVAYGQYDVVIPVESQSTGVSVSEDLRVVVSSGVKPVYQPDVRATVLIYNEGGVDMKINPQEPVIFEIGLENRNTRDIEDLSIRIKSDLIDAKDSLSLGPLEKKTVNITVEDLNDFIPPQETSVEIMFFEADERFKTIEKEFEFISVNPDFEEKSSTVKSFLKSVTTISVRNVGNVVKTGSLGVETNLWSRIFTSTKPKASVSKEEGKSYYVWDLELAPNESVDLVASKSYRFGLFLLIVAVLLVIGYQMIKPHVIIRKKVIDVIKKEEGISEIKVALIVRNISSKKVKNVRVSDVIPKIASYVNEEIAGSMVPSKVRSYELMGTHLEWEIPELSGTEERIIRYKIRTKIGIIGSFKLPSAEVRYESKSGKRMASCSSKTVVGAEEE